MASGSSSGSAARRNTVELLRNVPRPVTAKAPLPLNDVNDYTKSRVKESLAYAASRLLDRQRVVSPLTGKVLKMLKGVCKDILNGNYKDEAARIELIDKVQITERAIFGSVALRHLNSKSEQEFVNALLQLRKHELYSRYSDYMAVITNHLRKLTKFDNLQGFQLISSSNYWTDINTALEAEREMWRDHMARRNVADDAIRYHSVVKRGSSSLGLEFESILQLISAYAARNDLAHMGLAEMLKTGDLGLQRFLTKDLMELEAIFWHEEEGLRLALKEVILFLRNRWFDDSDLGPNQVGSWAPKPQFYNDARQMRKDGQLALDDKRQAQVDQTAKYMELKKKAKAEARVAQEQRAQAQQQALSSSVGGPSSNSTSPSKRIASSELPASPRKRRADYQAKLDRYLELTVRSRTVKDELRQSFPEEYDEHDFA